ncbi:DUF6933 domain-containing protein [Paenibacillus thiaminolyticus]|uniref:DUF6933 domain-containing protein n=1 Tax=Paenibacillus thiaminolyticus TaxID=49283 RepID=UPI002543DF83|nr:hypothetical protein [Paenibacillus thiaminolyticus]WII39957.1 hypothetical protein O0V01_13090 [Paenibacillus thiaminolyticus]
MNVAPAELGGTDPLFSWHVNILQLRRKHIIFVNDSSRLCLIVNGIRSSQVVKLQEKFISKLEEYLLLEGVKRSLINQYLFEAGEVSIGKTNVKSVLGTMNEMSFYCKGAEFDHTFDLCAWLNSLMYKPINYEEPIKVFKQTLETKYS